MKPGDLVRLHEKYKSDTFALGNSNRDMPGENIPNDSLAIIVRIDAVNPDDPYIYVIANGTYGWAYTEDCELISEGG